MKFSRNYATTVTISQASPATLTCTAHELYDGDTLELFTTGTLPAGLSTLTTYYVLQDAITPDTFRVSAARGGDAINTTSAGSGTHTFIKTNVARLNANVEDTR